MSVTEDTWPTTSSMRRLSGPLPMPPSKHVAVVACMDARLDVYQFWGSRRWGARHPAPGSRHRRRIRSLAISQRLLSTREIILITTPIAACDVHRRRLQTRLQDETGIKRSGPPSRSPTSKDVRQSLRRIELNPFVTKHESLRGFVFPMSRPASSIEVVR